MPPARISDGAGLAQSLHQEGVIWRHIAFEQDRAAGGWHVDSVDIVLEHHRNAVQRPAHLAGLALGVESTSDLERLGIKGDDGVNLRTLAVIGGDAISAA